jgi:hypothetical protein
VCLILSYTTSDTSCIKSSRRIVSKVSSTLSTQSHHFIWGYLRNSSEHHTTFVGGYLRNSSEHDKKKLYTILTQHELLTINPRKFLRMLRTKLMPMYEDVHVYLVHHLGQNTIRNHVYIKLYLRNIQNYRVLPSYKTVETHTLMHTCPNTFFTVLCKLFILMAVYC